jgi:predicted nucleic acid-binding protein
MATKVLDSWSVLAFLEDHPVAAKVEALLIKASQGKAKLLLSAVSWGEIYSSIAGVGGREAADSRVAELATLPIEVVAVAEDLDLARRAAWLRASKGVAFSKCFAAALAQARNVELVTGDPELLKLKGEVKMEWLE